MPAEEKKLSKVEDIKSASQGLYGSIPEELGSAEPFFSEESTKLLKHHGTYQQDDRDVRTERKKAGLDRDYSFMVRTKFPGGRISAEQYLLCDALCDKYGEHNMRITTRQDFQFHGVVKSKLRALINGLNRLGDMTTLGGCGDVVRNTVAAPVTDIDSRYKGFADDLIAISEELSAYFMPKTTSYYDIWLDDEKAEIGPDGTVAFRGLQRGSVTEPIYGQSYMPRKFKIGLAADFDNSVDVYTQDLGIIAVTENNQIVGYEILVGGGLGFTHRKPDTFPRLGTPLAFVSRAEILPIVEAVVKLQRDHGGRADRRWARLKYVVESWGIEKFREVLTEYAGRAFALPRGIEPSDQPDYVGWHKQSQAGLNYVGVWVENGRVVDYPENGRKYKTGLRAIVEKFSPSVRLTPHQNIILANIRDEDVDGVKALMKAHGLPTHEDISALRRWEMACPALPYCGLAMSESERMMPDMMTAFEEAGHGDADVMIRMTGCPNGCARSRTSEIGIIGAGADRYQLFCGGDYNGTRLNECVAEKLTGEQVVIVLSRLLDAWKAERQNDERFGDWSYRLGAEDITARVEALAS